MPAKRSAWPSGDVASVIVFDTRKLDDGLDEDLRACPRRDAPGIVFYTLRARFKTAAACVASIVQHRLDRRVRQDAAIPIQVPIDPHARKHFTHRRSSRRFTMSFSRARVATASAAS